MLNTAKMLKCAKVIQIQNRISYFSSLSVPKISNIQSEQKDHASRIFPDGFRFLTETSITRKRKVRVRKGDVDISLWDYIMSYARESYQEKAVLMDPDLASDIAECIRSKSEKGPDTFFIDSDGGFCQVSQNLLNKNVFQRASIFLKDINLELVHDHVSETYLKDHRDKVKFKQVNLVTMVPEFNAQAGEYISPLCDEQLVNTNWNTKEPPYTLYGTVTHSLVKYLTTRCLHRNSVISEFFHGRPEFFFIVTTRTWKSLSSTFSDKLIFRPMNILFQLIYDSECLMELPKKSFFPWRNPRIFRNETFFKKPPQLDSHFALVRIRPKVDIGLSDPATPEHLEFFVNALFRNKEVRVIPLFEKWIPGIGLMFVKEGHSIYKTTGDLETRDIVPLLNKIAGHPHFKMSNFHHELKLFQNAKFKTAYPDRSLSDF